MGGTTISYIGKTVEEVLDKLRKGIIDACPMLSPDSDVALVNPSKNLGKIYKAELVWDYYAQPEDVDVKFTEIEKGDVDMPIAVASLYGIKPTDEKPWVGCVHLHT